MDERYRGTIMEEILPLIQKPAEKILAEHGVSKAQYALWLYWRSARAVGIEAAVVVGLCVGVVTALVATLLTQHDVNVSGRTLIILIAYASVVACIFSATAWVMRHSSGMVRQQVKNLAFLDRASTAHLSSLSPRTWDRIASFVPDIDRLRFENIVIAKTPSLRITEQRRIALLAPWRKAFGWASLLLFATLFFVGETGLSLVSALLVTLVGAWLFTCAAQIIIARQIVEPRGDVVVSGKPAKIVGIAYGVFSVCVTVIGILGLVVAH